MLEKLDVRRHLSRNRRENNAVNIKEVKRRLKKHLRYIEKKGDEIGYRIFQNPVSYDTINLVVENPRNKFI